MGNDHSQTRRLVIRGVNWLGDAVMTLPALQRLREHLPEAHLTVLTHQKLADLWQACRSIDSVRTFFPGESPFVVGRRLRPEAFDTALVLPNSPRAALEVWWAGVPRRIGYSRPWRNWFLTDTVEARRDRGAMRKRRTREIKRLARAGADGKERPDGPFGSTAHQLHDYLLLASTLGANPQPVAPKLELESAEVESGRAQLAAALGKASPGLMPPATTIFLGAAPAAAYGPAKRWPAEDFATALGEIAKQVPGAVWVLFGAAADHSLCARIAASARARVVNLAGKSTLRELMSYLAVCRVVLTNDSGPMHVAAAVGTPVVVLFGSTSPELTAPGLPGDSRHRLLSCGAPCSPCFRPTCPIDLRCLTGIGVEQVVGAVLRCLDQSD